MRECYRKALKARQTKSGQASTKTKPWRLEQQMSFMKPFLAERQQQSNYPTTEDIVNTEAAPEVTVTAAASPSSASTSSAAPSPLPSNTSTTSQSSKKRKCSSNNATATSVALQEYLNYKKTKTHEQKDHLTKYFQAVEETVRTFPAMLQIEVKSKISEILHQAELQNLSSQTRLPTGTVYPQEHQAQSQESQPYIIPLNQQSPQTITLQSTNLHTLGPQVHQPHSYESQSHILPIQQQLPQSLASRITNVQPHRSYISQESSQSMSSLNYQTKTYSLGTYSTPTSPTPQQSPQSSYTSEMHLHTPHSPLHTAASQFHQQHRSSFPQENSQDYPTVSRSSPEEEGQL